MWKSWDFIKTDNEKTYSKFKRTQGKFNAMSSPVVNISQIYPDSSLIIGQLNIKKHNTTECIYGVGFYFDISAELGINL